VQISSTNNGPANAGVASRRLISCIALAAVLAVTATAAKADDSVSIQEIKALKARLNMLEKRLDKQAKVTQEVVRQQAAYPGPSGPYEPPMPWDKKFHLNGITLTPGGFLAAEGVYRTRDTGGDFSPAFGSLPLYNAVGAHMGEFRETSRQSRVSMLAEGAINPDTLASGYMELDFLGAGITSNSEESNSYVPRIRHLYATVDWNDLGLHVLGGQTWSLATLNNKGITPRNEDIPLTIDAQYVAGFTWARQAQIRVTKNFGKDIWFAVSAENPQTLGCAAGDIAGGAPAAVAVPGGTTAQCQQVPGGGSGQLNPQRFYSFNHVPDVIAKAAWEPTIVDRKIHVEAFGIYTDLYDSTFTTATGLNDVRHDTTGWGAGGSVIVQAMPKLVDLQGSAMIGRGIGRYGSGQLDTTGINVNGSLAALPEIMFLGGAIVHATPQLDLYAYGGEERILNVDYQGVAFGSTFNPGPGTGFSGASPSNAGCHIIGGACAAPTEATWEATAGFWDKVYDGSFGSVRVGLQYVYAERQLFESGATAASRSLGSPWFNDQMVYSSFRYYPFDAPVPPPAVVSKY
jgi:hypothetical protein